MKTLINFTNSGLMGDFINALYACKQICKQKGAKANLYLGGPGGDPWRYGTERAYCDLKEIILQQEYINKFELFPPNFNQEYINLTDWRKEAFKTRHTTGKYNKCWTNILADTYDFKPNGEYAWIKTQKKNADMENKILIHQSDKRHNSKFNWELLLSGADRECIFITSDIKEYRNFQYKDKCKLCVVESISAMAYAINSCYMFIGNQSSPFALASALDKKRICELEQDASPFYINEERYSKNLSWYLDDKINYNAF